MPNVLPTEYPQPPAPPNTGEWSFVLTDAQGGALADLTTAAGRSITLKRNTYTEVTLTVSHEDDAAALLLGALGNSGVPKLKGYRRAVSYPPSRAADLLFRGPLAAMQEVSEETSLLTATFRSPYSVLLGDGDALGRFMQDQFSLAYYSTDAGAIAKALVDLANADAPTGLATDADLIVATVLRDREYPTGQNLGAALQELTSVLDGFDFYETYIDGIGSTDAFFNVVPQMGEVRPEARFEYGETTLSNVSSLGRTTQPPVNCMFITGGNGLTAVYEDPASVDKYGKWWGKADFSSIIEQATLDDKARALVRPNPVETVSFVPELGLDNCPKPFDDWNLGDQVPLFARRGALAEDTQVHINGLTIPIDENGFETVSVDDPTSPAEDAVIRAALVAEVLDGS